MCDILQQPSLWKKVWSVSRVTLCLHGAPCGRHLTLQSLMDSLSSPLSVKHLAARRPRVALTRPISSNDDEY
ncbi:hypothetical protein EYF80_045488 [Liparis tanakae]|uniref:Uncharacterized protein n=1 Tax=Liparis tanakae TaxID=230148 RepID=A0A4Z2FU21_9TELE|nr:hypothetical protein EYF80_045488 [Liparis tanakae]